jgi:hypothetical protein
MKAPAFAVLLRAIVAAVIPARIRTAWRVRYLGIR